MAQGRGLEYKYIVATIATFGLFMELLDATIVNVAVPTLSKDLNASTTAIQWVVTGYLLSLAVFIPVSGWAGDRFGTKRTFMVATALFTVASLMCALATTVGMLIFFRVLQGVGAGMMTPVGTAMIFRAFPAHERSKASGIMVIPTTFAPASGPVLGGFLVEFASWHWIFLINIPFGLVSLYLSARYLKEHKEPKPGRFDPAGFVLAGAGLASLLYALTEAGRNGFADPLVSIFGGGGVVLLVALVYVELRVEQPMLDMRLFRERLFRACNITQFVAFIGFSGSLFLLPIMLQAARGLSPFQSGLTTFPQAIGVMLAAQPTSRLYSKIGPQRLVIAGLAISSVTSFGFVLTDFETNLWWLRALMFIRGIGFGLLLIPMQAGTFSNVPQAMAGRASSFFSSSRIVAQSFGVAIITTVLTTRLAHYHAPLAPFDRIPAPVAAGALKAFHEGFIAAGLATVVGIVVALLLIRDRDAAASMRPRTAAPGVPAEAPAPSGAQ